MPTYPELESLSKGRLRLQAKIWTPGDSDSTPPDVATITTATSFCPLVHSMVQTFWSIFNNKFAGWVWQRVSWWLPRDHNVVFSNVNIIYQWLVNICKHHHNGAIEQSLQVIILHIRQWHAYLQFIHRVVQVLTTRTLTIKSTCRSLASSWQRWHDDVTLQAY